MITQLESIAEFAIGQIYEGDSGETLEIVGMGSIHMSLDVVHYMVKARIVHKGLNPVFTTSNVDNLRAALIKFNMRLIGNVKLS